MGGDAQRLGLKPAATEECFSLELRRLIAMWNVIRGLVTVLAAVAMAVLSYMAYVNTLHEQARRKTATVEVTAPAEEPATAIVTVTATRPPARAATPSRPESPLTVPPATLNEHQNRE